MPKSRYLVVLLPSPLSLLSAFAYFLYRKFDCIDNTVITRYRETKSKTEASFLLGEGLVCNLDSKELLSHVLSFISSHLSGDTQKLYKRWAHYCHSGYRADNYSLSFWLLRNSLRQDPKILLEELTQYFRAELNLRKDPYQSKQKLDDLSGLEPIVSRMPGKRFLTLPIYQEKGNPEAKSELEDYAEVVLSEAAIWLLAHKKINIVVGGESGVGKSSFAASLMIEMINIIRSLRSRENGWEDLPVTVTSETLDLATPVLESILWRRAKDRQVLPKRPWTLDLAIEAVARARDTEANIVISDLPGKETPITELVASQANVVILIVKDWEVELPIWTNFCNRLGIEVVAKLKSTEFSSAITRYQSGKIVCGKVHQLQRVACSWDRAISQLAEFLLFDILPTYIRRREETIKRVLAQEIKQASARHLH